jgi:hypothetical protein
MVNRQAPAYADPGHGGKVLLLPRSRKAHIGQRAKQALAPVGSPTPDQGALCGVSTVAACIQQLNFASPLASS